MEQNCCFYQFCMAGDLDIAMKGQISVVRGISESMRVTVALSNPEE